MDKSIVYVDMDGVLCDFKSAYDAKKHIIKYPQAEFDFFRKLKPIEGAIHAFNLLFNRFDTYILTSPSIHNPLCYMEKRLWVEDHLGFSVVEKLIFSNHKELFIGDYLIDDHCKGQGQDLFKGELIHFGADRFKSWSDVMEYFKLKG
jgi:5'-nucleotidase